MSSWNAGAETKRLRLRRVERQVFRIHSGTAAAARRPPSWSPRLACRPLQQSRRLQPDCVNVDAGDDVERLGVVTAARPTASVGAEISAFLIAHLTLWALDLKLKFAEMHGMRAALANPFRERRR
jgi:hypothetical protein